MTCHRGCQFGYLGTREIPLTSDPDREDLTEADVVTYLEFMERLGEKTRVRPCPCRRQGEEDPS